MSTGSSTNCTTRHLANARRDDALLCAINPFNPHSPGGVVTSALSHCTSTSDTQLDLFARKNRNSFLGQILLVGYASVTLLCSIAAENEKFTQF